MQQKIQRLMPVLVLAGSMAMAAPPPGMLVPDPAEPGSMTCGIQEALDQLPEGGGAVYIPVGVHVVRATIRMKPNTTLMGAGKGSIIRKDPAWIVYLTEDVSKTSKQEYVVVADASALKPKMSVCVGNLAGSGGEGIVERIEGNKVFIRAGYRGWVERKAWTPSRELLLARKAAMFNGFPILRMSSACVLSDLALDGNKAAQTIRNEPLYKTYEPWWQRLRCAPYIDGHSRIERCWIYDTPGVAVSLGGPAVVQDCDISGSWQGIHLGGGPHAKIINNTIHDNETSGISFCLGNYGLIVQGNHIHHNGEGISALGVALDDRPGRNGDHFSIISDNVIYHNNGPGIASGQGRLGPCDFVISGNIVYNNNQCDRGQVGKHQVPAGISLFNAQRCVIMGNRCFDDQDKYLGILAESVSAGALELPDMGDRIPIWMERWTNIVVTIRGPSGSEVQTAVAWSGRPNWRENKRLPYALVLAAPLARDYPSGTEVIVRNTQVWGLFVGGPESSENIVANNLCAGNRVGGLLWSGRGLALSGNLGTVIEMDAAKTLVENVHPYLDIPVTNGGFEGKGGWQVGAGASYASPGHTGQRALRLAPASGTGKDSVIVFSEKDALPVRPNTRYRVIAWVKSDAQRVGAGLVLPRVYMMEADADGKTRTAGASYPVLNANGEKDPVTTGQWNRVMVEACIGPRATAAWLRIQMEPAQGEAWVDDVRVQQSPDPLPEVQKPSTNQTPSIEIRNGPSPADEARLDFLRPDGKPAAQATRVKGWWNQDALFFRFVCADSDPAGLRSRTIGVPGFRWTDDVVAVLLQPNIYHEGYYYQFAVSSATATFSQGCSTESAYLPAWQAKASLTDGGWEAEMAIPLSALTPTPPAPGDVWGVQFGRVARGLGGAESSAWPPSEDWHNVRAYGRLVFAR